MSSPSNPDSAGPARAKPLAIPPERIRQLEAQIAELHRQMEGSQWWPVEKLRQWQLTQAGRLAAHAREHAPFYAERLSGLRVGADGAIEESSWRALPILTKQEIRSEMARLKSRSLPPDLRAYSESTSGSTGVPLEILKTSAYELLFRAVKMRMLHWHGYDPKGKICEIRRPYWKTGGPVRRIPVWEWPFGTMYRTGQQVTMDIFSEPEAQRQFLEAEAPEYLLTAPSNLRLLLRSFQRAGKRLPSLRLVRTTTERLDPDLRNECQEIFGVPIVDAYGCQEGGFLAIQCPEHTHYHVQSEMNLVEVLREDGTPCGPGETGRVVITPLHAFAMPLLRYELGDYAEVGAPCPCGRGLPVLRRIYGRIKDTLSLPSGERRYSILMSTVFKSIHTVIQYQVVQKSLTLLEVRMVVERPLDAAERELVLQRLIEQVGPGFELQLVYLDSIPRMPGGKYTDFFSEVDATHHHG